MKLRLPFSRSGRRLKRRHEHAVPSGIGNCASPAVQELEALDAAAAAIAADWQSLGGKGHVPDAAAYWKLAPRPARQWLSRLTRHADAARDRGDAVEGAYFYQATVTIAPWRLDLKMQLGNMLKDSGRLPEAEAVYRAIMAEAPDEAEACLQLGHVYNLMGRRKAAIASFREAVRRDDGFMAAHQELFAAGETEAQRSTSAGYAHTHGREQIAHMAITLDGIRAALDDMARALPDVASFSAFPAEDYASFRRLFDFPAPPVNISTTSRLTIVVPQRNVSPVVAAFQIAALSSLARPVNVITLGASAALRQAWDRPTSLGQIVSHAEDEHGLAADLPADRIILLAPGRIPHRHLIAWMDVALAHEGVGIAFCDEEVVRRTHDTMRPFEPYRLLARPEADGLWLSQCDIVGGTLALSAEVWRTYRHLAPREIVEAALADARGVTHVPYALVSTLCESEQLPVEPFHLPSRATEDRPEACTAIICTRDNAADCRRMVESLFRRAHFPECLSCIIVDNGTSNANDLKTLQELALLPRVRILTNNQVFNWSALNNAAAAQVETPNILFCNDDMEMLTKGWDETLDALLRLEKAGAVGARLLYPDDTIQHAGVLLGWKGSVIHDGLHEPRESLAHFARWGVTREASAVTGAFLGMRRSVFVESGGFDADRLPVAYSDIDLCLRLRARGMRVIWTPLIDVRHDESVSRGLDHLDPFRHARNMTERAAFEQIWGEEKLSSDFTVNPIWADATMPLRLIRPVPAGMALRRWRYFQCAPNVSPYDETVPR